MVMADTGYFDSVSANLKTGVGAQVKGISEGVKANSDAGVSPSVNALDTGVKAAAAIGGLADGLSEAAMLPVLGAMGMKGMACLPISKQLDPVIGVDIHLVTIPPSPVVPMPHPYVGVLLRPQDFIAAAVSSFIPPPPTAEQTGDADSAKLAEVGHTVLTMAVGMLGATVKIGGFIPRAVASTPTRSIPHIPMGAGWAAPSAAIPKNNGHAFMGSLTVLADGMPFSGGGAHLHLDCNDVGIPSVHKVPGMFLPTGVINPIPPARQILTSPVPVPLNPMAALARKCTGAFGRFYKKKDQEAGGQAAQQGQQDDKERIPQEHAPQGHLYRHWPPRGRGQRHVLHRRGGLLARRPGTSVMGTHMVQPQRLPGSSGQRVAPRLRHGHRRGHGRRHADAPHE